ncbi:hypothetical protein JCM8097_003552 [Rhodosporidiobolus ruineniae]
MLVEPQPVSQVKLSDEGIPLSACGERYVPFNQMTRRQFFLWWRSAPYSHRACALPHEATGRFGAWLNGDLFKANGMKTPQSLTYNGRFDIYDLVDLYVWSSFWGFSAFLLSWMPAYVRVAALWTASVISSDSYPYLAEAASACSVSFSALGALFTPLIFICTILCLWPGLVFPIDFVVLIFGCLEAVVPSFLVPLVTTSSLFTLISLTLGAPSLLLLSASFSYADVAFVALAYFSLRPSSSSATEVAALRAQVAELEQRVTAAKGEAVVTAAGQAATEGTPLNGGENSVGTA